MPNEFLSLDKFSQTSIYLIYYSNYIYSEYSFGSIINICKDNYNFSHTCKNEIGSFGAPLISLNNFKIIGINKIKGNKSKYFSGFFIKGLIEEFKSNIFVINNIRAKQINFTLKNWEEKDEIIIFVNNTNFVTFHFPNFSYTLPCTGNEKFKEIEELLYNKYPEYRNIQKIFIIEENGRKIDRFKTINENNCGFGVPILMLFKAPNNNIIRSYTI